MSECHCGLKKSFEQCCKPIIDGEKKAITAEQLMRARYSAYVDVHTDFLHDSLHHDGRETYDPEATKEWAEQSNWLGLQIIGSKAGQASDHVGSVDFIASYTDKDGVKHSHAERSQFKKLMVTGYFVMARPLHQQKLDEMTPVFAEAAKSTKSAVLLDD